MPEGSIRISSEAEEDDSVIIRISDTGAGIPPEKLAALFDLSFSARADRMGMGLGLPTAYNIIKQHQGDITVTSSLGKGTEVSIKLPLGQGGEV